MKWKSTATRQRISMTCSNPKVQSSAVLGFCSVLCPFLFGHKYIGKAKQNNALCVVLLSKILEYFSKTSNRKSIKHIGSLMLLKIRWKRLIKPSKNLPSAISSQEQAWVFLHPSSFTLSSSHFLLQTPFPSLQLWWAWKRVLTRKTCIWVHGLSRLTRVTGDLRGLLVMGKGKWLTFHFRVKGSPENWRRRLAGWSIWRVCTSITILCTGKYQRRLETWLSWVICTWMWTTCPGRFRRSLGTCRTYKVLWFFVFS